MPTELEVELAKVRAAALAYLRADYLETNAWAKTLLCTTLGHPDKYPAGQKPKFKPEGCPCGQRRGIETA